MSKNLVLVESPSKAKTISKYLGKNYIVEATIGHIRDLPRTTLGIDLENGFKPKIVTIRGKSDVLKKIKSLSQKSKKIFIATDPDREGEAIAQDICEIIKNGEGHIHRVLFNEITEKGVKEGMESPQKIDENLVYSQRARRVMDRIIGYQISPLLWNHLNLIEHSSDSALSAGRVQSVALRIVCEREVEINSFIPVEYWSIVGTFETEKNEKFAAKLFSYEGKNYKLPESATIDEETLKEFQKSYFYIKTESEARRFLDECKNQTYKITRIDKKIVNRNPSAPFITSTLQQEASKKLYYRPRQTMQYAQKLYEGIEIGKDGLVGLITYMRTDSTRLNTEAVLSARDYIAINYGKEYLPDKPKVYSSKKSNVQDAHEAIRPTNLKYTPEFVKPFLSKEQFKLYELIWNRFIACQMNPAKFEQTSLDITGGDYVFRASGSTQLFRGFLIVYDENGEQNQEEEDIDEKTNRIPVGLFENQKLVLDEIHKNQHFTKPAPRYYESSLVKELDNLGIGRPSTYASIISTLHDRGYIEQQERKLFPTELGVKVNKLLVEHFEHIFNVNFTALMEKELDDIAEGSNNYENVLRDFYIPFKLDLKDAEKKIQKTKCEQCGSDMIIKIGRFGRFLACTNYPNCKNIKSLKGVSPAQTEIRDEKCPKCNSDLVIRNSKFGRFIGCTKYPDCDYTKSITLEISCPKCKKGEILQRITKRKKVFYGCSNYPECDYASWDRPTNQICPNCEKDLLVIKFKGSKEITLCNSCKFTLNEEND
jgi:DNA topoisomerase-1